MVVTNPDNRLRRSNPSVQGSDVDGQCDAQDRLVAYGTTTYEYTAAGELGLKTTPAGQTTYSYDALGNLRTVDVQGDEVSYTIDGQNRRIWKAMNGACVTGFLYRDALQIVAQLDCAGNVLARFVYGSRTNVPDVMLTPSGTYRILSDHLGSPRVVTVAATGAIVGRIDCDGFGNVLPGSSVGVVPFGFAGGLYDADTGLLRFGARDYDPETGRWTSKDPARFGGGDANLYAYVGSDPVNYVDPAGRQSVEAKLYYYYKWLLDLHDNRNENNVCPSRPPEECTDDGRTWDRIPGGDAWRGSDGSECIYDEGGNFKPGEDPFSLEHAVCDVLPAVLGGHNGHEPGQTQVTPCDE